MDKVLVELIDNDTGETVVKVDRTDVIIGILEDIRENTHAIRQSQDFRKERVETEESTSLYSNFLKKNFPSREYLTRKAWLWLIFNLWKGDSDE